MPNHFFADNPVLVIFAVVWCLSTAGSGIVLLLEWIGEKKRGWRAERAEIGTPRPMTVPQRPAVGTKPHRSPQPEYQI